MAKIIQHKVMMKALHRSAHCVLSTLSYKWVELASLSSPFSTNQDLPVLSQLSVNLQECHKQHLLPICRTLICWMSGSDSTERSPAAWRTALHRTAACASLSLQKVMQPSRSSTAYSLSVKTLNACWHVSGSRRLAQNRTGWICRCDFRAEFQL